MSNMPGRKAASARTIALISIHPYTVPNVNVNRDFFYQKNTSKLVPHRPRIKKIHE